MLTPSSTNRPDQITGNRHREGDDAGRPDDLIEQIERAVDEQIQARALYRALQAQAV